MDGGTDQGYWNGHNCNNHHYLATRRIIAITDTGSW
jgi:hypothetical protein